MGKDKTRGGQKESEDETTSETEDRLMNSPWKQTAIKNKFDEVPETPEPTPTPVSPQSPLSQSQEIDEDVIISHSKLMEVAKEEEDAEPKTRAERRRERKKIRDAQPKSIYEYRIVMPMTSDQLNIGFQYTIARSSVEESTKDDKVRVLSNKSCVDEEGNNGQHTLKLYHIKSYFPSILSKFMSDESLKMYEDSKDCFPHTYTECTSKVFKTFNLSIETRVIDGDRGYLDNALGLTQEELKLRNIVNIDILNTPSHYPDPKNEPSNIEKFKKSDVCCLKDYNPNKWRNEVPKVCCAYKLVKCNIIMPLATMITKAICKTQGDVFTKYYKSKYEWADCWAGMSIKDVESMTLSVVEEESDEKSLEIRRNITERRKRKEEELFGKKNECKKVTEKDKGGEIISPVGISSVDSEINIRDSSDTT